MDSYYDSLLDDPVEQQEIEAPAQQDDFSYYNPESLLDDPSSDTNEPGEETEPEDTSTDPKPEVEEDALTSYLKSRGIEDLTKIQFENDEGKIEEKDWNSLSKEEQLTMLQELSSSDYTEDERNTIEYLRRNNTNLQGIIDYFSQKAINDYLTENPDKVRQREYEIDEYSDDELYVADLKIKYPDFTVEELNERLASAKVNEDLFKKEVDALRTYYKEQEENDARDAEEQTRQAYENLQNSLLNAASSFVEVKFDMQDAEDPGGFEIEDSDRQRALAYLLAIDKDGQSQFDKDLSDPNALFELAYLRTSARDLLNGTSQYYKKVIAETRKELAKTKKALEKYEKKGDNTTVVNDTPPKNSPKTKPTRIEDLWG